MRGVVLFMILIVFIPVIVVGILLFTGSGKHILEGYKMKVFREGRFVGVREPGFTIIIP